MLSYAEIVLAAAPDVRRFLRDELNLNHIREGRKPKRSREETQPQLQPRGRKKPAGRSAPHLDGDDDDGCTTSSAASRTESAALAVAPGSSSSSSTRMDVDGESPADGETTPHEEVIVPTQAQQLEPERGNGNDVVVVVTPLPASADQEQPLQDSYSGDFGDANGGYGDFDMHVSESAAGNVAQEVHRNDVCGAGQDHQLARSLSQLLPDRREENGGSALLPSTRQLPAPTQRRRSSDESESLTDGSAGYITAREGSSPMAVADMRDCSSDKGADYATASEGGRSGTKEGDERVSSQGDEDQRVSSQGLVVRNSEGQVSAARAMSV